MIKKLLKLKRIAIVGAAVLVLAGCRARNGAVKKETLKVGFDVDDTLLFSTPAFQKGFQSDTRPFSDEFWEVVNTSDRGNSMVKESVRQIVEKYRAEGAGIYAITARKPYGGEELKEYLKDVLDIPGDHTYFEPDGKTGRLNQLGIDIFYGDSDSDITAAQEAGIKAYRIERSTASSYQEKYNPGKYGEEIIENTEW
ncbi:MAG: HAD family acid phosphatase [Elusimicrobiota bacterium]|nr:HAD family acid phosphatase [Elusimicrobiota bacterium]